ncbi:hypothetical protein MWU38_07665 [Qipengyuania sp. S6317L1]|uniref:hypothetical protein n=1 Tax=Qipengyuania sp. S6317L1 TaxID=2926410 RepID=UPI001FF24033|nr:hypothetical protein [Qipengyuania sp. S6317L1]MCK0099255.1 hypothetical protein [Qipengyuania sp. S6317L1]
MYWVKQYFSQPDVHWRSITEVLIIAICSLAPYFITAFVKSATGDGGVGFEVGTLFARGQIYLLAYALFGTILWLAILRGDRPRHAARAYLGMAAILLVLPIVGFIGVDPTFSTIVNDDVVSWGYWFYGAFLLIHYLLLFYMEIAPPDLQDTFKQGTKSLDDEYNRFKNGQ